MPFAVLSAERSSLFVKSLPVPLSQEGKISFGMRLDS